MKWVDLTDALFCRAEHHLFMIKRPEYRNDIIEWRCLDSSNRIIADGKTVSMRVAKQACKDILAKLKRRV